MPQTTQVATVTPPASAGAACSRLSTSGPRPASSWLAHCATSGGTQGASQSGTVMLPAPDAAPVSAPAFETVQTAMACSAQAASDHSASRAITTNQLRA